MVSVNGYNKETLSLAKGQTVVDAFIDDGKLLLKRENGSTVDAGSVQGAVGVIGDTGNLTSSELVEKLAPVVFTDWISIPLAAGWNAYTAWTPPRYRYNATKVELDGVFQYTGANVTGASSNMSGAFPTNARPPAGQTVILRGSRSGMYDADLRMAQSNGILTISIKANTSTQPRFSMTLSSGQWVALTGISYPKV